MCWKRIEMASLKQGPRQQKEWEMIEFEIEFDPQSQLMSLFKFLKKVDMEMLVVANELSPLPLVNIFAVGWERFC